MGKLSKMAERDLLLALHLSTDADAVLVVLVRRGEEARHLVSTGPEVPLSEGGAVLRQLVAETRDAAESIESLASTQDQAYRKATS